MTRHEIATLACKIMALWFFVQGVMALCRDSDPVFHFTRRRLCQRRICRARSPSARIHLFPPRRRRSHRRLHPLVRRPPRRLSHDRKRRPRRRHHRPHSRLRDDHRHRRRWRILVRAFAYDDRGKPLHRLPIQHHGSPILENRSMANRHVVRSHPTHPLPLANLRLPRHRPHHQMGPSHGRNTWKQIIRKRRIIYDRHTTKSLAGDFNRRVFFTTHPRNTSPWHRRPDDVFKIHQLCQQSIPLSHPQLPPQHRHKRPDRHPPTDS